MRKTPWQHGVHPGRQASHDPWSPVCARRLASASDASTICTSSASRRGSMRLLLAYSQAYSHRVLTLDAAGALALESRKPFGHEGDYAFGWKCGRCSGCKLASLSSSERILSSSGARKRRKWFRRRSTRSRALAAGFRSSKVAVGAMTSADHGARGRDHSRKGAYLDRYCGIGAGDCRSAGNACSRLRVQAGMAYEIGGTGRGSLQGQNEGSVEFDDSAAAGSVESRLSTVRTLVEDVAHSGERQFVQDVKVDGQVWRVVVERV